MHLKNRNSIVTAVFAVVLLLQFFVAANAKGVTLIPIFFVTDRALDTNNTSTLDFLNIQMPEEQLLYGIKGAVPRNSDSSSIEPSAITGLGWISAENEAAIAQIPNRARDITLKESEFFARLHEYVDPLTESRPLIVFAHGCCTSFSDSMKNAANLARYFSCPVVTYAWCAVPPTIPKYRDNEDFESSSESRFDAFMRRIETEFKPGKVILIAHSMGNRLAYSYLKGRYSRYGSNAHHEQFKATDLACADVKASDFAANENRIAFNSQTTWITANDADKALLGSYLQSALYVRLGAPKEHLTKLTKTHGVNVVNIYPSVGSSHDLPANILSELNRANIWTKEPLRYAFSKDKTQNLFVIKKR